MAKLLKSKKARKVFRKILVYVLAALGLVALFGVLHYYATLERGYRAIGGEIFVVFIPLFWVVIKDRIVKELKEIRRKNK